MQELSNSIKRPNLRIMGIEEGEEGQAKRICNMFSKIIKEKFPNLEKVLPIELQEALIIRKRLEQNRTSLCHNTIKKISTDYRKRILKAIREEKTNNI
jgi:hypothetical protein